MKRFFQRLILSFFLFCVVTAGALPEAYAKRVPSNGKYVQYFPSTKQVWKITWRKNDSVVRKKIFFRSGKLYKDIIYRDGTPIVRREYYKNGERKSLWVFKTQQMRLYDEEGRLKKSIKIGTERFR